jgi:hypothetical protein
MATSDPAPIAAAASAIALRRDVMSADASFLESGTVLMGQPSVWVGDG